MTQRSKTVLKGYFEAGDRPNDVQFNDLFDSIIVLDDNNGDTGDATVLLGTLESKGLTISENGIFGGNIVAGSSTFTQATYAISAFSNHATNPIIYATGSLTNIIMEGISGDSTSSIKLQDDLTFVRFGTHTNKGFFEVNNEEIMTYSTGSGTSANYIYMSGSLGIGTDTPDYNLHISEDNPTIYLESSGETNDSTLSLRQSNEVGYDLVYDGGVDKLYIKQNTGLTPFTIEYGTPNHTLFLDSSGNVGIGLINPAFKLDVDGDVNVVGNLLVNAGSDAQIAYFKSTSATPHLRVERPNNTTIDLMAGSTSYGSGLIASHEMFFSVNGDNITAPSMTIDSNSKVGIGISSPAHKLHIKGDDNIVALDSETTLGKQMLFIGEQNAYGVGFRWNSGLGLEIVEFYNQTPSLSGGTQLGQFIINNEHFYWKGDVGIGLIPSHKLEVLSSNPGDNFVVFRRSDDLSDLFRFTEDGSSNASLSIYDNNANKDIMFNTDGDSWIDTADKFGLGTASPSEKLHVKGTTIATRIKVETTTANAILNLTTDTSAFQWLSRGDSNQFNLYDIIGNKTPFRIVGNNPSDTLVLDGSGNVGIGTASPTEKLQVQGAIKIPIANTTNNNSPGITAVSNDDFAYTGEDGIAYYLNHYGFGFHNPLGANPTAGKGTYISGYFGVDIFTAGANRIHVAQNGNIGIGTDTPSTQFEISSTGATILHLHRESSDNAAIKFTNTADTTGYFIGMGGNEKFSIAKGSNLNTSPFADWDSSGNARFYNTTTIDNLQLTGITLTAGMQMQSQVNSNYFGHATFASSLSSFPNEAPGTWTRHFLHFPAPGASTDPGYLMHQTSTDSAQTNYAVLHISPSDDNASTDYIAIHGYNDPEVVKIDTDGGMELNTSSARLGIGQTRAQTTLDGGALSVVGDIVVKSSNTTGGWAMRFNNTNSVASNPDIQFNDKALLSAEDNFIINIDSDNNSTSDSFQIKHDSDDESGATLFQVHESGDVDFTGVMSGDGSGLTNIVAGNIQGFVTNGVNNRVLTAIDADSINGEANFTFDGTRVGIGEFNGSNLSSTAPANTDHGLHIYNSGGNGIIDDILILERYSSDIIDTPGGPAIMFKFQDTNNVVNEARIKVLSANTFSGAVGPFGNVNASEGSNNFVFETMHNGTASDKMIIRSDGRIGIGTTVPTSLVDIVAASDSAEAVLSVRGTGQGTGRLYIGQSNTHGGGLLYDGDGTPAFAGSAGVDKISFYRTTNGVHHPVFSYKHDSDNVEFEGKVGIGTATPQRLLHLDGGPALASELLRLQSKDDTGDVYMTFYNNSGNRKGYFGYGSSSDNHLRIIQEEDADMYFATNSTTRVTFDSNGKVGIGTTTPKVQLHVAVGTDVTLADGSGFLLIGNESTLNIVIDENEIQARNNAAKSELIVQNEGGDFKVAQSRLVVKDAGNVGIGTGSPSYKLHVAGEIYSDTQIRLANNKKLAWSANTDSGFIRFNSVSDSDTTFEIGTTDNSNEPIIFTQSGNERARIISTGIQVSERLTATNSQHTFITNTGGGYIEVKSNDSSYGLIIRDYDSSNWANIDTNNGLLNIGYNTNTNLAALVVDDSDYVGIGCNPSCKLEVAGEIKINHTGTTGVKFNDVSRYWLSTGGSYNWGLYWNTTDNLLEFRGNGDTKGYIDLDSGNIQHDGWLVTDGYIRLRGAPGGAATGETRLGEGSGNALKIQTPHGFVQIGPQNDGHMHFATDRSGFYFEKNIRVNSGLISSYDEDLVLRRDYNDTSYNQLTIGDGTANITLNNDMRFRVDNSGHAWIDGKLRVGDSFGLTGSTGVPAYALVIGDADTGIDNSSDGTLKFYGNGTLRATMVGGTSGYWKFKATSAGLAGVIRLENKEDTNYWDVGSVRGEAKTYFGGTGDDNLFFQHNTGTPSWIDSNVVGAQLDFTGVHMNVPDSKDVTDYLDKLGYIVVSNGSYANIPSTANPDKVLNKPNLSESLPLVHLSDKEKDKRVWGVIAEIEDPNSTTHIYTQGSWNTTIPKSGSDDTRLKINSVGEGAVMVCNINGNLENGDYITTSAIAGLGMKQDDDLLHNYTVAKITQDENFATETTNVTYNGQTYKVKLVGCTYHCG